MKQQLLLSIALGLTLLTACGGDQSSSNTTTTPRPVAAATDPVVVYSHRYLLQDLDLYKHFESQSRKKLSIQLTPGAKAIELAQKGQLKGDLVVLEDLYQAHQLKEMGAIEPYNANTFDELIPSKYVDFQGYWGGVTKWTMSFVYRTDKAEMAEMQRYAGVLNPKYKGRVVVPHPDSSGLVTFVASMLAKHGEKPTRIYLQMLNKNLVAPPSGSDWDALQAVLNKDADIAFMNGSAYLRYQNSGNAELYQKTSELTIDVPVDATGDNYFNITPICMLKNAANRDYAIPLVEYLTSQETQNVYSESMMEYPLNVFSETTNFLNNIFNIAQGNTSMEDTENQLDRARELIRTILGA